MDPVHIPEKLKQKQNATLKDALHQLQPPRMVIVDFPEKRSIPPFTGTETLPQQQIDNQGVVITPASSSSENQTTKFEPEQKVMNIVEKKLNADLKERIKIQVFLKRFHIYLKKIRVMLSKLSRHRRRKRVDHWRRTRRKSLRRRRKRRMKRVNTFPLMDKPNRIMVGHFFQSLRTQWKTFSFLDKFLYIISILLNCSTIIF